MLYLNQRLLYLHSLLQRRPMLLPGSSGSYHADTGLHQWILIDLYQFSQWVLKSSCNRNCASLSYIELRILLLPACLQNKQKHRASFTITYCTCSFNSFNSSTMICSDSLEAVPFPTEIRKCHIYGSGLLIFSWTLPPCSVGQLGK